MIQEQSCTILNNLIIFRPFQLSDINNLISYFNSLSDKSKNRFGPHPFNHQSIEQLHHNPDYMLFVAIEEHTSFIAAYFIIKKGWLSFEYDRYQAYGLKPNTSDCTIAPSVSEYWQGNGLGSIFFSYIKGQLYFHHNINRYFLWGGVQSSNQKAIRFYKKNGFKILGHFDHDGSNTDMMLKSSV